ncbi:hypothetical protein VNI00_009495 [Paramarasmius palmivorus]|uniref:Serpentine receptor class gamma n=1 Tax=Paramarasmius palmivorus TaxID=297713 RepID=A0AAW0CP42_9AGAR
MDSPIPEELAPYLTVEKTIILPISSLSAMYFVYGIYVLLFGTYLYMMRKREKGANQLYLWLTVALFVLTTIFVVFYTIQSVNLSIILFDTVKDGDYVSLARYLLGGDPAVHAIRLLTPVFINITAEWMLVRAASTYLRFVDTIMLSVNDSKHSDQLLAQANTIDFAYSVSSAIINAILTLLTAARIWRMHQEASAQTSDNFVQIVSRIFFESGVIYPIFQIANLIDVHSVKVTATPFDVFPLAVLSAGVAPTLIMVRARLGKNVDSLQTGQAVSDIRFGESRPGPTTTVTQVQSHNIALTDAIVEPSGGEGKMTV